ncbi:hypothetical protein I0P15_15305 [Acinetobacter baumannii]|nr:hypothetical protein [Acinetobacter baumannii]
MTVSRTLWQNVQQYIWLVGGIVCLFLAFIFWVITDNLCTRQISQNPYPIRVLPS